MERIRKKIVVTKSKTPVKLSRVAWMAHFMYQEKEYSKTGLCLKNKIGVYDLDFHLSWIGKNETVFLKDVL